jgi:hypothetical protein
MAYIVSNVTRLPSYQQAEVRRPCAPGSNQIFGNLGCGSQIISILLDVRPWP